MTAESNKALTDRLRAWRHGDLPVARVLLTEAADEIERLRGHLRDTREQLQNEDYSGAESSVRKALADGTP